MKEKPLIINRDLLSEYSFNSDEFKLRSDDLNDYPDGIIIPVNKPYRWTSADVIRKVKFMAGRHFHKKNIKVGHAGTLDPLATGVLLVCIGKATKLAETLQKSNKEYIAGVTFGATTPSYDLEKDIDKFYPFDKVNQTSIEELLEKFVGEQEQIAPLFSAKSVDGVRAYELARKVYGNLKNTNSEDRTAERKELEGLLRKNLINIYDTELISYSPATKEFSEIQSTFQENSAKGKTAKDNNNPNSRINLTDNSELGLPRAEIRIACSKGTYVRAVARDIGEALDTGAHLDSLIRSKNGGFTVENAISVEDAISIFALPRKTFKVGDLNFSVTMHDKWKFMTHTPNVQARIELAKEGQPIEIRPTRAGDKIPSRTFVRNHDELPENFDFRTLDFSQYEPFITKEKDRIFNLDIKTKGLHTLTSKRGNRLYLLKDRLKLKELLVMEEVPPFFAIYQKSEDEYVVEYRDMENMPRSFLYIDQKHNKNTWFQAKDMKSYEALNDINSAIMLLYALYSGTLGRLLLHASCVDNDGQGNLFLGVSGTGKSTHSRLWLENIDDTELVNDDNPILDVNTLSVYGSPWSGKTPCYRNIKVPLNAIVRLEQGSENQIKMVKGLEAYASLLPASANIRWNKDCMNALSKNVERVITSIRCYKLSCLPNKEATLICQKEITK